MYLDDLDALLRGGASVLGADLRARQLRFILNLQHADGGFGGRRGPSDLYYTDFALRILTLLAPGPADAEIASALSRVASFMNQASAPGALVDCFCALNAARMLNLEKNMKPAIPPALAHSQLPCGAFSRPGAGAAPSAYATFLAALAFEMLSTPFPHSAAAIASIQSLKRPDGGFADLPAAAEGQTSATAAAIAFLTMTGALTSPDPAAVNFLLSMQAADGGFRAAADAPESDLLSTFTAMVSLFALDAMRRVDLKGAVRFTGTLAAEAGGFRACPSDSEPDIEYTFYGLGVLALVRAWVAIIKSLEQNP